jgi:hypothetical protein
VEPIHHGKLGVRHRERRSLQKVPWKCGRRTALLGRFGLSPQIEVLVRWVGRIGGEVGNIIIGGLAPGRGELLLQILLLLTPPHLLKLERNAKPYTPGQIKHKQWGKGNGIYLNGWKRPSQREEAHLLEHLLRVPLVPRKHQLGRHINQVVVVRGVRHSGSRQQSTQVGKGETGRPKCAH